MAKELLIDCVVKPLVSSVITMVGIGISGLAWERFEDWRKRRKA